MKKLLLIILFTFALGEVANANIIKLDKCYFNKTTNTTDRNWVSFYDSDKWEEKNFLESNKVKYQISQYNIAIGLKKIPSTISENEFRKYRDNYQNWMKTANDNEKKIAKEFYEKYDLFHKYIELEDSYYSINLNTGLVSSISIRTDEYISYMSKIAQLDYEYREKLGVSNNFKARPLEKISRTKFTISDYTNDKVFASRTYEMDYPTESITTIDIVIDLKTYIVHHSIVTKGNDIFKKFQNEFICKPYSSSGPGSESGGSSGTAFFVTNKGHLITNNHVVDGCSISKITYQNKDYDTKLLATDKTLDLALLKADLKNKSYLDFSGDEAKKMQKIYVGGYPLGKGLSNDLKITSGIVSSLKGFEDNSNEIQIDAAINPGNSGGPIINEDGELIAIAVSGLAKDQTEGINFGIKASAAERFLKANKLKANKSLFSISKNNNQLLEILEEATVYTYCN